MRRIWRYRIEVGSQFLDIPGLDRFLAVGMQEDQPVVWAIVRPTEPTKKVLVHLKVTGDIPPAGEYIGTFQHGWFVGHVFWELAE